MAINLLSSVPFQFLKTQRLLAKFMKYCCLQVVLITVLLLYFGSRAHRFHSPRVGAIMNFSHLLKRMTANI